MTKTSDGPLASPEDDDINLDEIPEFDFSRAVPATHVEWAKRAKGHFYEVTDEEDAKRQASLPLSSGTAPRSKRRG